LIERAKEAEMKDMVNKMQAFIKKKTDAPSNLSLLTIEQNAKATRLARYNFSSSFHVRFLFAITICFTLLIMACVITFIAWMVN
jgi:hypothetical protein